MRCEPLGHHVDAKVFADVAGVLCICDSSALCQFDCPSQHCIGFDACRTW
jgi:hypothetical protein